MIINRKKNMKTINIELSVSLDSQKIKLGLFLVVLERGIEK